ncbi:MAG: chromosomal replication initiator protein DnaA, partial [Oscillospiraceae bacterium]|nr:chromosomal replication initiator protein DnaA [Oscillospiraceae bacterium]
FLGSIKNALNELFSTQDFEIKILNDNELKTMKEAPSETDYLSINEYTFEHFVVGDSNKFAHAAALAVTDGQKKTGYNPLYIYGDSGLGKTHLLYAISHAVEQNFPHYNVVYVTGEEFLNELVLAIQQGKNVEFREKYRTADFFLMDDIQFIAGKKMPQEELFNTFNTLYELGKQIVFTSDRPPNELDIFESRMHSRFTWGLPADIQPPDYALRLAIIKNKAAQLGVILPNDVIIYIAESLDSNVRLLEGAVKRIIAYRDLMDVEITVDTVKNLLKDMFRGTKDLINIDMIIEETAKYFSYAPEELKSKSRTADLALARQTAMYMIRKLTNLSLEETGEIFDRHHSTVMSSVKTVIDKMKDDNEFSKAIRNIASNIDSKTTNK